MYGGKSKKKGYSKKNRGKPSIKLIIPLGGGKVKKEFRDSFLKKIAYCSKHFDLYNESHHVKEKVY